jgi:hypothetical protein
MLRIMGRPLKLLVVGGLLLSFFLCVQIKTAHAQTAAEQVCAGLGAAVGGDGTCTDPEGSSSLSDTVKNAINVLSLVVGIVAVIMVIIGGMKYVSSQGDSSGIASAKNTIIYALVGLIIVALAQVIVRFVLQRSTEAPVAPLNTNVSPEPSDCSLVNGVLPPACR